MDGEVLEKIYQESLEERVIAQIAKERNISYGEAMDQYYNSRLSEMIQRGDYDIQYLDYKVLAAMILSAETGLIQK